ncbi:MAG: pyridoxal phosphate-dependent aminotransferase [Candidatus Acidiferrum sp.]
MTPNPLSLALAERRLAGLPVIDLTASNPTECGFTYDGDSILAALANPASLAYEPDARGLLTAREVVSEYYSARGERVAPENIILTTSTSEAYSYAFRLLCDPGDEILVPQPSYPLFDFLADLEDVRLVRYPLLYDHGWQIDFHALQEAITGRTRGVIVVNPNNPTGNFCKVHEMAQLNEICVAREMAIIADEVFLDYALGETAVRSFAGNAGGALTFTMSGISKICGLPQMKASWLVTSGADALRGAALERLEVVADTYLSMNAPVQHALPAFLRLRHAFQRELQERVRANLAELDRQLERQDRVGEGCTRLGIEGGWYAVVVLPANSSSDELAMRLLNEYGIYVHPGHYYEFASARALVVILITPSDVFASGVDILITAASKSSVAEKQD